ncbi:MAG: M48 family metallopeptidase [Planctomycetes bacterium]|nr:M48 family metallopeptidase [Planctomycetota bacterium]
MNNRFTVRIVIAIAIALSGVVAYYARSSVNPVTGENQHISLTAEQETALGLNAAPQMAAQMGGNVPPDDPDAAFVRAVGERLVLKGDASRSPYHFDFHLLNDTRTINAFALPGGQVFITRGLLSRLKTEAQLAGVLGHEIGHVINRHGAEHLSKAELAGSLSIAVGVGASDGRGGSQAAYAISQVVSQMVQLKYSRSDELEADQYGLATLPRAGYDPSAMLGVMEILAKASAGGGQPEFMSSHPHPENRIEAIRAWLGKNYPGGVPGALTQGRSLRAGD